MQRKSFLLSPLTRTNSFLGGTGFWCAVGLLAVTIALLIVSGFTVLSWLGLALTIGGLIDYLFFNYQAEGWIASEVYGEPGEELWRFRSFVIMASGPFVILYSILFA